MAHRARILSIVTAMCLAASPAVVSAKAAVSAKLTIEKIELVTKEGVTVTEVSIDERRVPGDLLRYRLDIANAGPDAANEVVINYPVPAEVRYEGETAPDTLVSVDGGKIFSKIKDLMVATGAPAGEAQMRVATFADVTHVRWPLGTLAANSKTSVIFRAVLK
jgi:uncharacterized repeat protein (TIGR01451 family)